MLLALFSYFVIAVTTLALICMPSVRARAVSGLRGLWGVGARRISGLRANGLHRASHSSASAKQGLKSGSAALRRHATPLLLALTAVTVLPIGAALIRGTFRIDSFDPNAARAIDARVADLLNGENLVPPAPLPPDFFTTPEVEEWQPMARSASRQWELLDAAFRQRLLMAFKLLHEKYGYEMVLVEGYRSPQRQAALAALGPSVTRAGPFESYHQFGLAADCAFLRNGRIVISEKDPWAMAGYEKYGEVAKSVGLTWGGDWRGLRDLGHVESHRPRPVANAN